MRIVLGGSAKQGDRALTSSTEPVPGISEFNQSRRWSDGFLHRKMADYCIGMTSSTLPLALLMQGASR